MFENKANIWISSENWTFTSKDEFILIENISVNKTLATTIDGKVVQEDFEADKSEQLWTKGELDTEGYFTLEISNVTKVLTVISESVLEIKGNYEMESLIVEYLPCFFYL